MKLANGLLTLNEKVCFEDINNALNDISKDYSNYSMFIKYLKFRFYDAYDLHIRLKAIDKEDIVENKDFYKAWKNDENDCICRLYGPFILGRDTDDVSILLNKNIKELLKEIILDSGLNDNKFEELLKESKMDNIYDFYYCLYLQSKENKDLNVQGKRTLIYGDKEYYLWNYINLRYEQKSAPKVDLFSFPKETWDDVINEYKNSEIDDKNEPNDLETIISLSNDFNPKITNVENYDKKLAGAVVARFAGCMLGAPVECWSVPAMEDFAIKSNTPFPPTHYWNDVPMSEGYHYYQDKRIYFSNSKMRCVMADDDVTYTVLNAILLNKYGYNLNKENVIDFWKDHLPYACTAEYETIIGLRRDESFKKIVDSNPYVELIGAAIRADSFGYVCPGNPYKAAVLAYEDAVVTHKRNGIYGEMFLAATIAASFYVSSPIEAIKIGMNYIPKNCRLIDDLNWALSFEGKIKDYRHARQLLDDRFPTMNKVHTNNNMCAIVFSLFMGENDFDKTISNCVAMGYDNDCTGASVGSILGAFLTIDKIDKKWYECFNNEIHTYIRGYEKIKISDLLDILKNTYKNNK